MRDIDLNDMQSRMGVKWGEELGSLLSVAGLYDSRAVEAAIAVLERYKPDEDDGVHMLRAYINMRDALEHLLRETKTDVNGE